MHIKTLQLSTFRNITDAVLDVDGAQVVALVGHNGSGKTSILESLSLLSPGRGLNRAKVDEIIQEGCAGWGVFVKLTKGREAQDQNTVGMAMNKPGSRKIKINDADVSRQTELAHLGQVVWFTPKMDRLFLDAAAARRDFLDRLTFGLRPTHAQTLNAYKYHQKNRQRLLRDGIKTGDWIELEEEKMAKLAAEVMLNRLAAIEKLNTRLTHVQLAIVGAEAVVEGGVAEAMKPEKAEALQAEIQALLAHNRERDFRQGDTAFGPHRSDVVGQLNLPETLNAPEMEGVEIPLSRASSGQHKRAVVEILMAQARLLAAENGQPPLVLLDEITAHLDAPTLETLLGSLVQLGAQVWLAGTDEKAFSTIPNAQILKVSGGKIFS